MNDVINNELLEQMVEVIVREADPEAVILFGSRARGDARPGSDVDFMVIEREPFSPQRSRRAEFFRISMALRHFPCSKDILLYSKEEFEHWKDSASHVVGRAVKEGRIMYAQH